MEPQTVNNLIAKRMENRANPTYRFIVELNNVVGHWTRPERPEEQLDGALNVMGCHVTEGGTVVLVSNTGMEALLIGLEDGQAHKVGAHIVRELDCKWTLLTVEQAKNLFARYIRPSEFTPTLHTQSLMPTVVRAEDGINVLCRSTMFRLVRTVKDKWLVQNTLADPTYHLESLTGMELAEMAQAVCKHYGTTVVWGTDIL